MLEDQIIDFLQEAGLWEAIQKDRDFHFKILNGPYIPLVIERLGNDLCFTHYLSQNGDTYIDTEMVFAFQGNDRLKFKEVAVPNALQGGELRGHDRAFAKIFANNIVAQGFIEGAKEQFELKEIENTAPDISAQRVTPHLVPEPSLKVVADEVRGTDLEGVLIELGFERDRYDKHKWRDGDHTISISDQLFMDWLADKGGGGAIDLVMHVRGCEFKAAVEWLSGRDFSRPAVVSPKREGPKETRPLAMPAANEQRWAAVQRYLVETRKLPLLLVERLHEKGLIYADDFQNAVFVRHEIRSEQWRRGEIVGASLRGTWGEENRFRGMAPGSVRNKGWFWLGTGQGQISRVMITESPIDAMSLAMCERARDTREGVTIYLSVDGAGAVPVERLSALMGRGRAVIAAFDADKAGEMMAWRLARVLPGIERLRPKGGKDWNDVLMGEGGAEASSQLGVDRAQLGRLWGWHRAAVESGRREDYLGRIVEVSLAFVQGEPLSQKVLMAMRQDLEVAELASGDGIDCSR